MPITIVTIPFSRVPGIWAASRISRGIHSGGVLYLLSGQDEGARAGQGLGWKLPPATPCSSSPQQVAVYLGSRREEGTRSHPAHISRPPRASPRDLEISARRYNGDNHLTADRGTWIRGDTRAKPSPLPPSQNIPLRHIPARAAQLPRLRAQTTADASSFELSCRLTLKWQAARCRAL